MCGLHFAAFQISPQPALPSQQAQAPGKALRVPAPRTRKLSLREAGRLAMTMMLGGQEPKASGTRERKRSGSHSNGLDQGQRVPRAVAVPRMGHSAAFVPQCSCSGLPSISPPKCCLLPQGFCAGCSLCLEDCSLRKLALNVQASAHVLIDSSHVFTHARHCAGVGTRSKWGRDSVAKVKLGTKH